MTTPPESLFARIKTQIDAHICCTYPEHIKTICDAHELRLREVEAERDRWRQEVNAIREQVFNPEIMAGYKAVPSKLLFDAMMLIDPPPIEQDGKIIVFRNPIAAEVLTKLSAIIRQMTTPQPEKKPNEQENQR